MTTEATPSSSTNYVLYASYGTICLLWGLSQVILVPYVVHLLILVTCILYGACHGSIVLLEDASKDSANGDDGKVEKEIMRQEDALTFPIVGSASLFGLYLAFKYLGAEYVNLLIGGYFGIVGCLATAVTIAPFFAMLVPKKLTDGIQWVNKLSHPFGAEPIEWTVTVSVIEVLCTVFSAGIVALYFYLEKPWFLNNILGICFCLQGIERFSLGTYKIGAILLMGLFVYDIFWVFGTDVMVTVAKNLDGPIKILFPRSLERNDDGKLDLSLLGLGDIVIPGFFLALLLRFDAHRAKKTGIHDSFSKPYFHTTLFAYVLGLGTTLFVMIQFNAAQPALLYLVPACLGSSFLCAWARGEVKELLAYSEEEEEEEEEVEDKNETKKDN